MRQLKQGGAGQLRGMLAHPYADFYRGFLTLLDPSPPPTPTNTITMGATALVPWRAVPTRYVVIVDNRMAIVDNRMGCAARGARGTMLNAASHVQCAVSEQLVS